MPCHDTAESVGNIEQTIVSSHTDSQADHGADSDLCSPLCSCTCCGTLIISPYVAQIPVYQAPVYRAAFLSETKDTASYNSLLWQPPKLV